MVLAHAVSYMTTVSDAGTTGFLKSGHLPTLIAALLYFDVDIVEGKGRRQARVPP